MPDQQLSDLSVAHDKGGQVSRDPDAIQREIEETRAELARTVDLIADRLSPKRAASRGASKVKSSIDGVFHREASNGHVQMNMPHGEPGSAAYESGIRSVPLPPSGDPQMVRTLRKDRVIMAVAAAVAVVGFVVLRHHRKH